MSFDPMAAANDWIDYYRGGDLESLLGMYADNAVTECACGGVKTIAGKRALRAYWEQRLKKLPAFELCDLQPYDDGAAASYITAKGIFSAVLEFDGAGQIKVVRCGPAS
jgi:ketosteroid isomerase-like protein